MICPNCGQRNCVCPNVNKFRKSVKINQYGAGDSPHISVRVHPDTKALIEKESAEQGYSQSEYCRIILEIFLDHLLEGRVDRLAESLDQAERSLINLRKSVKNAEQLLEDIRKG